MSCSGQLSGVDQIGQEQNDINAGDTGGNDPAFVFLHYLPRRSGILPPERQFNEENNLSEYIQFRFGPPSPFIKVSAASVV